MPEAEFMPLSIAVLAHHPLDAPRLPLLAMLERALDDLGQVQGPSGRGESAYARGFPVGQALARQYVQRCLESRGPHGLALLVERMLDLPAEQHVDPARKALFAGFCWHLEQLLHNPCCGAPND